MKRQQAFGGSEKLLKGGLHCHTRRSDGAGDPADVIRLHYENGYDFLALTDHRYYNYENFAPETPITITITNSDKTTTTYYAVVLFENHDVEAWYADAFAATTSKMIDDWYKAELDKKLITFNWDAIDDIL